MKKLLIAGAVAASPPCPASPVWWAMRRSRRASRSRSRRAPGPWLTTAATPSPGDDRGGAADRGRPRRHPSPGTRGGGGEGRGAATTRPQASGSVIGRRWRVRARRAPRRIEARRARRRVSRPLTQAEGAGTTGDSPYPGEPARVPWLRLSRTEARTPPERPARPRTVLIQVIAGALAVVIGVAVAGAFASRRVAERESVTDAAHTTDLIAQQVVQQAISIIGLISGNPAALAAIDRVVRHQVLKLIRGPGEAVDPRRADRLLRRAAPDRPALCPGQGGARRAPHRSREGRGQRPEPPGEPLRARPRRAARGVSPRPSARRQAAAVRDLPAFRRDRAEHPQPDPRVHPRADRRADHAAAGEPPAGPRARASRPAGPARARDLPPGGDERVRARAAADRRRPARRRGAGHERAVAVHGRRVARGRQPGRARGGRAPAPDGRRRDAS